MSFRTPGSSTRTRAATWRPFFMGVMLGLVFLLAVGYAVAQPFNALLRASAQALNE